MKVALLAAAVVGLSAHASLAFPVTVTMTGRITEVAAALGGTFAVNDAFTLSYTYDTTAADTAGNTALGFYRYQSFSLDVGGDFTVQAPTNMFANRIQIVNTAGFDQYAVDATSALTCGPSCSVGGLGLAQARFQLSYVPTFYLDDALPVGAPTLPHQSLMQFRMDFRLNPFDPAGQASVLGVFLTSTDDL